MLLYILSCPGMLPVTLQSQREDPDAIYGTVDDNVYTAVGDTGQSYYSMVCICLHAFACVCVCMRVCVCMCILFICLRQCLCANV